MWLGTVAVMAETSSGVAEMGVSVIMPVLDEERHLSESVAGVLAQDWAGPLELIIVLGPSADRSDVIARRLAALDDRVRLMPNPSGRTAEALNAALAAARHPVIAHVDAHVVLPPGFLAEAAARLGPGGADCIGVAARPEGRSPFEQAVAALLASWLAPEPVVGAAAADARRPHLVCFRAASLRAVGGYDPSLVRALDWEVVDRIAATGGTVEAMHAEVTYRPRGTLSDLARQQLRNGRSARQMRARGRSGPSTREQARRAAPLLALAAASLGAIAGSAAASGGPRSLRRGWWVSAGYVVALAGATVDLGRALPGPARAQLPLAIVTTHAAWGAGYVLPGRESR